MPLLAEMMSIPIEPLSDFPELPPPMQTKFQTLSVLVDLLLALSARNPVFCLLEDGQWADASTQELLDLLMGRIGNSRILLIVTHRPEYNPRADSYGNVSALQLSRLARRDVIEMAQLALRELPSVFLQRIIDESDSIPLFIEELARGVIEFEPLRRAECSQPECGTIGVLVGANFIARLPRRPPGPSAAGAKCRANRRRAGPRILPRYLASRFVNERHRAQSRARAFAAE